MSIHVHIRATLCNLVLDIHQHAISCFLLHAGQDLYDASTDVCNLIVMLVHKQNAGTTWLA